jgi:sporulation protein YlmC with PRC-barrel domain
MKRLSELPGLDVYTDQAKFLGKIYDIIIDLQKGEIARLTLQPIESLSGMDVTWIKNNTVAYKSVVSVADIIVSSSKPREDSEPETAAPLAPTKPKYSFVPGRYR